MTCIIKKEIEKYVSTIKNDERKCHIWLKIETLDDLSTFVVGYNIPHQESNIYACLDKDQPFANLEDDIAYFKSKGEVIVFGDMNARRRSFQLDAQQSFMPHKSRMQGDIQMYHCSFDDEKESDKFGSYSCKCAIIPVCLL